MKKFFIIFGVFVCLISGLFVVVFTIYPLKYKNEILMLSEKYSVDKTLVASIIFAESGFDKNAKSSKGAIGLMQLMPLTAKSFYAGEEEFDEKLLFDCETNIEIGVKYLKYLFGKYTDEVTVLACYNAGERIVNVWKGDDLYLKKTQIKYKETLNYIEKVQKAKKFWLKHQKCSTF